MATLLLTIFSRDLCLGPHWPPSVDYCLLNMRMASTHLLGLTLTDYIMVSSEGKKVKWGWRRQGSVEDIKVFGLTMTLLRQEAKPTPGLQFPSVQYQSLPRPKAFSHGEPRYFSFGPCVFVLHSPYQGGRTWQPFVWGKNGHENFRQVRIYNFCDKCVVFASNRKFANLNQ